MYFQNRIRVISKLLLSNTPSSHQKHLIYKVMTTKNELNINKKENKNLTVSNLITH